LQRERNTIRAVLGRHVKDVFVIMRADRDVPAGKVLEVLHICQELGFEKFVWRARLGRGKRRSAKSVSISKNRRCGREAWRRHGEYQRLDPVMTPMIDVCFQIIIFFIANMRIILPEGDFNVTMPAAAPRVGRAASPGGGGGSAAGQAELPAELPAIKIQLFADKTGNLAGIQIGERPISTFKELRAQIRGLCAADHGPADAAASQEVEIDFDYNLKYQFVNGRGDGHFRLPGRR